MKTVSNTIQILASQIINAKYIKEEGVGKPGEKGYRPTLWFMVTPEGKKVKVDQKEAAAKWKQYDEKLWKEKFEKTLEFFKTQIKEADAALRNSEIGKLFDEIEELATKKFPAGSDLHGSDYLKQKLESPEIKKEWEIYSKSNFTDLDNVVDVVDKLSKWAKKQILELK